MDILPLSHFQYLQRIHNLLCSGWLTLQGPHFPWWHHHCSHVPALLIASLSFNQSYFSGSTYFKLRPPDQTRLSSSADRTSQLVSLGLDSPHSCLSCWLQLNHFPKTPLCELPPNKNRASWCSQHMAQCQTHVMALDWLSFPFSQECVCVCMYVYDINFQLLSLTSSP